MTRTTQLVYIAGPYSAPTLEGVEAHISEALTAALWCAAHEVFYVCPHLNSAHFDTHLPEVPVEFYYAMDLAILRRCDAILLVGLWQDSAGAMAEMAYAVDHALPCFVFETDQQALLAWYRGTMP